MRTSTGHLWLPKAAFRGLLHKAVLPCTGFSGVPKIRITMSPSFPYCSTQLSALLGCFRVPQWDLGLYPCISIVRPALLSGSKYGQQQTLSIRDVRGEEWLTEACECMEWHCAVERSHSVKAGFSIYKWFSHSGILLQSMGRRKNLRSVIHVTYFRHLLWNEMNYTSGSIDCILMRCLPTVWKELWVTSLNLEAWI